jgi:hypothetical protein
MQRRMGFGMAKQGLGQLAGGMFTGGGASGIMGGAAGMLGGAAGMAGGPWGMAAAKAAEVVQKVIQTMDAMVAHFSKYNASIGAAAGRFEVEQHKFNVTMGKATAPMLTAWSDMKGKLLEAVSAFAPVIKVVSTMIGNTFKSFGMVFQQVGRVVGTVMDSFKNLAAGVMWVVSRIPGSGMKEMDWGQSKRYVDEALDGEERGQGDFFRSTVGGGHGFGGIPAHKVANAQAKAMTKAQDDLAREKLKKERAKAVLLAMMLPPGLNLAALQAAEDKYEKELAKLDAQGAAPAGGAGGGAGAPAQPAAPVFPGRPAVHERPPPFFGNGIKAETHIEFHQQFKMQHELVVQQMLHQVREAAMASFHDAAIQIRLTGNIACSGLGGIPFL